MAKKFAPLSLVMYFPTTEEGKKELARKVASVHADVVNQYIKNLPCPSTQKEELFDAVIQTLKDRSCP